jgi:3-deoxy-manno-octulosonate cytidylyltransferase (CMP-KDO synthetase)
VYERASAAGRVDRVIVATDDERIVASVRAFGGEVVMTAPDHRNGSSRIAEVAASLTADLVVNVQGDEPEIEPDAIDLAVAELLDRAPWPMSTLACPLDAADLDDPNVVKVVRGLDGAALYFSRAPIPHRRADVSGDHVAAPLRHVGLYVYRRAFLLEYVTWPATPLERTERLEQLRVLERGYRIAVALVDTAPPGIDTPEQYQAFVDRIKAGSAKSAESAKSGGRQSQ